MKQRSILVMLLLCVLLLTGCGTAAPAPDATPTPTQEAAAAPTPTPDPLSTLPYEDGQLYAAAYLGYLEPKDLDFFRQTYFGGRELPVHHISDGDFYLIIPRDPNATVRLLRNDMLTQTSSIFYEQPDGSPFVIGCNISDIFPDVTVEITTSDGEKVEFSPLHLARGRQCGGRRARPEHHTHLDCALTDRERSPGYRTDPPLCSRYPAQRGILFFARLYRPLLSASGSSVLAQTTAPTRCISARFAACTASVTEDVQSESTTAS